MILTDSQEDQREAFLELLETSGQNFTFRTINVPAIIAEIQTSPLDATVPQLIGRSARVSEDVKAKSTIEFLSDAVPSAPRAGEDFIDSRGRKHRIKEMFTNELTYLCRCHISPGP